MECESWEGRNCELCGSREVAEIIYGLVPPNVESQHPDRRIILGGCVIGATSPKWKCLRCGHAWGRTLPDGRSGE